MGHHATTIVLNNVTNASGLLNAIMIMHFYIQLCVFMDLHVFVFHTSHYIVEMDP